MERGELAAGARAAIGVHGRWKRKLPTAVRTASLGNPAQDTGRDDQCGFGKWLAPMRRAPSIGATSQFNRVVAAHAAFDRQAGAVAARVDTGKTAAADAALPRPDCAAVADAPARLLAERRRSF